jgi:hypothetical protein
VTTIDRLSALDELAAGDSLVLYSSANSDARRATLTTLLEFLAENQTSTARPFFSQYSAPSGNFTVAIGATHDDADGSENVHLILTPTGTITTGAITLPAVAGCVDGQEVLLNTTQIVTNFSVAGNGAADVIGEPSTLAANAFVRLKFDEVTTNWYRVG